MALRLFIFICVLFAALPVRAEEITLDQAYKFVGDERVPFDTKQSLSSHEDARYMDHLFFVTDMAMRIRVQTLNEFYKGNVSAVSEYNAEIDDLLTSFNLVQTPPHLKTVQDEIIEALNQQKMFFNAWAQTVGTPKYNIVMRTINDDPLVLAAHNNLIKAYGELMQLYAGESDHNKKAFYAHLCALDFI